MGFCIVYLWLLILPCWCNNAATSPPLPISMAIRMQVNNQSPNPVYNVVSGTTLTITCVTDFPKKMILVVCGGKSRYDGKWLKLHLMLRVNEDMHNKWCTCKIFGPTGRNGTGIIFNVTYPPTGTNFTANSQRDVLEVSERDNVTITCESQGNPKPELSIKSMKTQQFLTVKDITLTRKFKRRAEAKIMIDRSNMGVFSCFPHNRFGSMSQTVTVWARCEPKLVTTRRRMFSMNNQTYLEITLGISSYPQPTDYALAVERGRRGSNLGSCGRNRQVDGGFFNVSYTSEPTPPDGTVVLLMSSWLWTGMEEINGGQFVLTIRNGHGHGMEYHFQVYDDATSQTEVTDCDKSHDSHMAWIIGVSVSCSVVLLIVVFLIGTCVGAKRKHCGGQDKDTVGAVMLTPSPDYVYVPRAPLAEAYTDSSHDYTIINNTGCEYTNIEDIEHEHQSIHSQASEIPGPTSAQSDYLGPRSYTPDPNLDYHLPVVINIPHSPRMKHKMVSATDKAVPVSGDDRRGQVASFMDGAPEYWEMD